MIKRSLIGIIACLLPVILLGCHQITATEDEASKHDNIVSVITKSGSSSELNKKPNSDTKTFSDNQAEEIAKDTAFAELKSVQAKFWPQARLDTILQSTTMIYKDNAFYPWNYSYSKDSEVYAFAIGNQGDYSKMLIIYVDAFGKVIKNEYYKAKLTPKECEKIALEAAKKAKKTVSYWKDAQIEHRDTYLMLCTPNYVFSLDDFNNELKSIATVMYEVWFRDTNSTSSYLLIYVDATTGDVIGGKYTSD